MKLFKFSPFHFFLFVVLSFSSLHLSAQDADEKEIRSLMDRQVEAWNVGNIETFMKGYWESDSLMFIGSTGIVYGYQQTLERYKRTYSDTAKMGKLSFHLLHVNRLSGEYFYVVGQWFLHRSVGDVGGYYNLLFRKIKGSWKIVADHSS